MSKRVDQALRWWLSPLKLAAWWGVGIGYTLVRIARGEPRHRHIVICGFARGGTSLLFNMLASALAGFEAEPGEIAARRSLRKRGSRISKNPFDVLVLNRLRYYNIRRKELDVIVIIRDVRDVITSVHPNLPDRYMCDYEGYWVSHDEADQHAGIWREGQGVRALHEGIQHAARCRGFRLHFVKYEDLVADADGVQADLGRTLGVNWSGKFSDFHRKGGHPYDYHRMRRPPADPSLVRETQAVDRSRAGKWAKPEHARRIAEQFTRHPELLEILKVYGYEQDDAWFEAYRTAGSGQAET